MSEKIQDFPFHPERIKPDFKYPEIPVPEQHIDEVCRKLETINGKPFGEQEAEELNKMVRSQYILEQTLAAENIRKPSNFHWTDSVYNSGFKDEDFRKMVTDAEKYGYAAYPYNIDGLTEAGLFKPEMRKNSSVYELVRSNYYKSVERAASGISISPAVILYNVQLRKSIREIDPEFYYKVGDTVMHRSVEKQYYEAEGQWKHAALWGKYFGVDKFTYPKKYVNVEKHISEAFQGDMPSDSEKYLLFLVHGAANPNDKTRDNLNETADYMDIHGSLGKDSWELFSYLNKDVPARVGDRLRQTSVPDILRRTVDGFGIKGIEDYMKLSGEQKRTVVLHCMVEDLLGNPEGNLQLQQHVGSLIKRQATILGINPGDTGAILDLCASRVKINGISEYSLRQEENIVKSQAYFDAVLSHSDTISVYDFKRAHELLFDGIGGGGVWAMGAAISKNGMRTPQYVRDGMKSLAKDLVAEFNRVLRLGRASDSDDQKYTLAAMYLAHYQYNRPFIDGSGRHGHVLANGMLRNIGLPKFSVPRSRYMEYVSAVDSALLPRQKVTNEKQDLQPLIRLMKECAVA